jgi:hypothetical protein
MANDDPAQPSGERNPHEFMHGFTLGMAYQQTDARSREAMEKAGSMAARLKDAEQTADELRAEQQASGERIAALEKTLERLGVHVATLATRVDDVHAIAADLRHRGAPAVVVPMQQPQNPAPQQSQSPAGGPPANPVIQPRSGGVKRVNNRTGV